MSLFVDISEFVQKCNICHCHTIEGGFLVGGTTGPWRFWVCLDCDDWLDDMERHNYDLDEGPK